MAAPAAFQGDFTDLRFVKGRKVCQVVIEIPIEAGASFVAAFGTPNPASSVPVAIARLQAVPESDDGPSRQAAGGHARAAALTPERRTEIARTAAKRRWGDISYAQQAGILCNEGAFKTFLNEEHKYDCKTVDDCSEAVRELCGVASRAFIDGSEEASAKFRDLESSYRAWLTVPA